MYWFGTSPLLVIPHSDIAQFALMLRLSQHHSTPETGRLFHSGRYVTPDLPQSLPAKLS